MFKFILATFPGTGVFASDEALKDSFYILFREVAIVVCAAIIFEGLDYYDVVDIDIYVSSGVMYCILLVLVIWVMFGITTIIFAKS